MRRRVWLVLAIAALVAASFAASSIAAKRSTEHRDKYITRGLDYLHSRQTDTGGFTSPTNTAWAILGAVANGERMGSSAWTVKGKNAFDYLQGTDIVRVPLEAATGVLKTVPQERYDEVRTFFG